MRNETDDSSIFTNPMYRREQSKPRGSRDYCFQCLIIASIVGIGVDSEILDVLCKSCSMIYGGNFSGT